MNTRRQHWQSVLLALGVLAAASSAFEAFRLRAQTPSSAGDATSDGKALYETRCARCHGAEGKGDGPDSDLLLPRPRDFTSGRYKIRSTESGSLPTDEDLTRAIREGLHGSAMPDWKPFLSEPQIAALVGYIKHFSPRFETEKPKVVALGAGIPATPDSVAKGMAVFERLRCSACHGTDGRGAGAIATEFVDDWKHPLKATDLTEPWTFHGGSTARDIYLRFRTGMNGTPMPSFLDSAPEQDMWHLANYVVSLGRKPVWQMTGAEVTALFARLDDEAKRNPVQRGEYLVETMGCVDCHTPVRADGGRMMDFKLAGGQKMQIVPYGYTVSYNLTSDKATGLGNWTDDQIKRVLTRGTRPDGSRMLPFPMPWTAHANLTPDDLNAIVAYLRTVPPKSNRIPPPLAPSLPVYLWGKFKMLILGQDPPGYIYPGNAGTPEAPAQSRLMPPLTPLAAAGHEGRPR